MTTSVRSRVYSLAFIAMCAAGCNAAARDTSATVAGAPAPNRVTPSGVAHEVEAIGMDYAFNFPDTLDAGRTSFTFTNKGKVVHEYNVVLLKAGVTLRQYIDAANRKESLVPLRDGPVGVLFAEPGRTSAGVLSAELLPGRTYAVQCIFRDSASAPSHREMGMFKSFMVRQSPTPATSAAGLAFDTIVGNDYAYTQYPKTLTPGWHRFVFVNAGKQRHEVSLAMLKPGATLKQALDIDAKGGDMWGLIEESLGVLHAEAGTAPLGSLDFDVKTGREYIVICEFSDTPKAPSHVALGMVASMVASKP